MAQPQPIQPVAMPQQVAPQDDGYNILGEYADAVRQSQQRIAARGQQQFNATNFRDQALGLAGLRPRQPEQPQSGGGGFLSDLKGIGRGLTDAVDPTQWITDLRDRDFGDALTGPARGLGSAALGTLGLAKSYLGEPVAGGVVGALTDEQGHFDPLNPRRILNAELNANPVTRIGMDLLDGVTPYSEGRSDYERFQASDAPTGVKVGADVLADPTAWVGPGALKGLGKVGSLVEQPLGASIGSALGSGVASQAAEALDAPDWVQAAAPLTGALAGGVAGANPRMLGKGAQAAAGELTEGRLASERGSFDPNEIRRTRPSGDPTHEPEPLGGIGAVTSPPAPAATGSLPELGLSGAAKVLADTAATTRGVGPLGEALYKIPLFRKGAAIYNPSINHDPTVHIAHLGANNLGQALRSDFTARMRLAADNAAAAMKEEKPVYRGPADNKIRGTWKDIADHPEHYILGPRVLEAMQGWKATTASIRDEVRGQFGVDVGDFRGPDPLSVFAPTVPTRASIEERLNAVPRGGKAIGGGSMTAERAYAGAYDLMQKNPAYSPITDPHELAQIIANGQANNAAEETFRLGIGGLKKADMMAQTHPELVKMRDEAMKAVDSARGRLATAESRSKMGDRLSDEIRTVLEQVRDAAPDEDYSPLATAMRRGNRRLDQLQMRGELSAAEAEQVRTRLHDAQEQLEKVRAAWKAADPTRNAEGILGEAYVLHPQTNRYHPVSQAKSITDVRQSLTGGAKQFADTMDWVRATHLNLDTSPLWIQGTLGMFQDPIIAAKSAFNLIGKNPVGEVQRIALQEPELVRAYSQATGKQFGQPIVEFGAPKGLDKLKPVAAANDTMQAVIQKFAYEQWKNDFQILLKRNPGMSPVEAQHEAAMLLSKTVPSLNPAERGLSPARAAAERAVFTSTSFATSPALLAKDMTSALVKFARHGKMSALDGREQLALLRGSWMLGSLTTLSVASAALAAESRGLSVEEAIREATDPRHKNFSKYFWAIQLGDGRSVQIGGPLRSFAKAIVASPGDSFRAPGESLARFAYSKLNSPISGALNLWFNQDYRGQKIRNGDFSAQLLDSLRYAFEQVAPTTLGAPSAAEREGATFGEAATDIAGQFMGANVGLPSPTERLDELARDFSGKDFFSMEPAQREEVKRLHPDAFAAYLAKASDQTQQAYAKRDELNKQQLASESALLGGQLSPAEWKQQMDSRRDQLRGAESIIYGDKQRQKPSDPREFKAYIAAGSTARDRYYRAIDTLEGPDGRVDWDGVDAWKSSQSRADQDYIDRNTGLGGTPLMQLRRQLSNDYYNLPVYRGLSADEARDINELSTLVGNLEGMSANASPKQRTRGLAEVIARNPGKYSDQVIYATQRRMLGLLKGDTARQAYEFEHPEIAIVKEAAPLNAIQLAAVQKRLGGVR